MVCSRGLCNLLNYLDNCFLLAFSMGIRSSGRRLAGGPIRITTFAGNLLTGLCPHVRPGRIAASVEPAVSNHVRNGRLCQHLSPGRPGHVIAGMCQAGAGDGNQRRCGKPSYLYEIAARFHITSRLAGLIKQLSNKIPAEFYSTLRLRQSLGRLSQPEAGKPRHLNISSRNV